MLNDIDISEDYIFSLSPKLLSLLLIDHTTSTAEKQHNIFWATNDYENLGEGYSYHDEITIENITGEHNYIIQPRVKKNRNQQIERTKKKAEVFTPTWVCNEQANAMDEIWFGRENVFNTPTTDESGKHGWISEKEKISFPKDKSWQDYLQQNVLEITCGEAPYLACRYDAATGESIPTKNRIGMLDRKLRIVCENTNDHATWLNAAKISFMSTYGYEWQGDSLLLARESLLWTAIDWFYEKFKSQMPLEELFSFANIISWNLWQMDGLKGVIPDSCKNGVEEEVVEYADSFFPTTVKKIVYCESCQKGWVNHHNGIECIITDWIKDFNNPRQGEKEKFVNLYRNESA